MTEEAIGGFYLPGARSRSGNRYLRIASGLGSVNGVHYGGHCLLYPRPTRRQQYDDRDLSSIKILLVPEARVGRNQECKAFALSRVQQLAVLQRRPAALIGSGDFVLRQPIPQWNGSTLVEQDAHLRGSQGAPCGVLEDRSYLCEGDARKPLDEL